MNLVTRQAEEKSLVLPRTYKDDVQLLKACQKEFDNDELKVTAILSSSEHNDIYGMSEQKFLELADKLDENRKLIDEETETETVTD